MRSAWTTNKNVSEPPAFLCLPNRCRRSVRRPQRTKSDWALEVAHLLDTRYAKCEQVTLVSDHLNTHTMGVFYEAFPPEQARAYVKRRNLVHTPKHGSWLNIAECERSCLTSQCLAGRRIGCLKFLQSEIATWSKKNNTASIGNSNSKTPEQNSKSSTPKLRPDKAPSDVIADWTSGRCPTIPSSLARAFGSHTRRARGHLQQIPIGIKLWND